MLRNEHELRRLAEECRRTLSRPEITVLVCAGTGCIAGGSLEVYSALTKAAEDAGVRIDIQLQAEVPHDDLCQPAERGGVLVRQSGCHGFCEMGPLVRVEPAGILYVKVKPEDAEEIMKAIVAGQVVERLLYRHPVTGQVFLKEAEIPFYARQQRRALANLGHIDPDSIYDYLAHDGYLGLVAALHKTPEEVCGVVSASGLRGRGGGGFPTGRKWELTRQAEGAQKYVVCYGDEGDPGAFMDRSLMEGDPHRVIEGMIIAGYAVGASQGYIYVRAEYPLAVRRLRKALADAEQIGLLGDNILGSGFAFHIKIKEGAGAFVCGEESALLSSIEGKRGMPRPKPPYPAVKGLFGCPTVINNVETFANVPLILNHGSEWFRSVGTKQSSGTKTFAITGAVANTGLIEVPMGVTLRDVVFDIGGGLRGNKRFKAVQIGGPSGGCLTAEHLDLPLDFDSLQKAGAMIGSGGLVVMDEDTCMVEVARFFMNFTQNESCGKCVLCREGTKRMLEILERIVAGKGCEEDLVNLKDIAQAVKDGSLCGLGKTAPNPVLTTMQYFWDEYVAHVREKRCPAGTCPNLKRFVINPELCKGCSKCARTCPVGAITGKVKEPFVIDPEKCIKCGACKAACRFSAVQEVA